MPLRFRPKTSAFVLLVACGGRDGAADTGDQAELPADGCYVQLFDGDDYSDDSVIVQGPGEFPTLDHLPGNDKNWDDEADSFKSGSNVIVTYWTEQHFEGTESVYRDGAQEPSIDEPRSMKIECSQKLK